MFKAGRYPLNPSASVRGSRDVPQRLPRSGFVLRPVSATRTGCIKTKAEDRKRPNYGRRPGIRLYPLGPLPLRRTMQIRPNDQAMKR
jgi:hypothetical protein